VAPRQQHQKRNVARFLLNYQDTEPLCSSMAFVFGIFFKFFILTALAELGDKTFFLTVVFAIWCPWHGIRDGSKNVAPMEYLLLLVGCSCALILRTLLLCTGVDPFQWDGFSAVAALVVLSLFAIKASAEWRVLRNEMSRSQDEEASIQAAGEHQQVGDPEAMNYGTTALALPPPDKQETEPWWPILCTTAVLPCVTILFAEAMDRSSGILQVTERRRLDLFFGASFGFVAASAAAVFCGYVIQNHVSKQWLLFLVAGVLWIIAFCSLRDALVRLVLGDVPLAHTV